MRLARDGHAVAVNYTANRSAADEVVEAITGAGGNAIALQADVGETDAVAAMFDEIEGRLGRVAILVNNAGLTRDKVFLKMTPGMWSDVIKADLDSIFNVTHQFVPAMVKRGFGRIINISSINGQKGMFGQTNYAAAKAGMHGFTMSLAQETARKGITVNTISPGYIATDMVMAVPEEIRDRIIAQIPVQRLGKPEEIAAAVAFLCSDDAAFITGANMPVNGGQFMG